MSRLSPQQATEYHEELKKIGGTINNVIKTLTQSEVDELLLWDKTSPQGKYKLDHLHTVRRALFNRRSKELHESIINRDLKRKEAQEAQAKREQEERAEEEEQEAAKEAHENEKDDMIMSIGPLLKMIIDKQQEQIDKQQEQIDALLSILQKMKN